MEAGWATYPTRWDGLEAAKAVEAAQDRVDVASRTSGRLIPQVLELPATTPARVLAKARVELALFGTRAGGR